MLFKYFWTSCCQIFTVYFWHQSNSLLKLIQSNLSSQAKYCQSVLQFKNSFLSLKAIDPLSILFSLQYRSRSPNVFGLIIWKLHLQNIASKKNCKRDSLSVPKSKFPIGARLQGQKSPCNRNVFVLPGMSGKNPRMLTCHESTTPSEPHHAICCGTSSSSTSATLTFFSNSEVHSVRLISREKIAMNKPFGDIAISWTLLELLASSLCDSVSQTKTPSTVPRITYKDIILEKTSPSVVYYLFDLRLGPMRCHMQIKRTI